MDYQLMMAQGTLPENLAIDVPLEQPAYLQDGAAYTPPEPAPVVEYQAEAPEQEAEAPAPEIEQNAPAQAQEELPIARNFRLLREAKERAEKERDEAIAYARQQRKYQEHEEPPKKPRYEAPLPYEESDSDDTFAEMRHVKEINRRLMEAENRAKEAEYRAKQVERQIEANLIQAQIRAQYPDFDEIVNADNVSMFETVEPELAQALSNAPDLKTAAISTYKMIKSLGLAKGTTNVYVQDQQLKRNLSKPKPAALISPQKAESPLSQANAFANGLTEDLRKKLWEDTVRAARQA